MSNKKYEFTEETINEFGHTLHRIRALIDIPKYGVKAGDLGGLIEKEENLSHEGNCWVADNARVFGNAQVCDNAHIYNYANVYESARIFDNAQVCGNAHVCSYARVFGNAWVFENAKIYGWVNIFGNAMIFGNACAYGDAQISGTNHVCGNANVSCDALITKTTDVLVIGPIGSRDDYTTFYKSDNGIMIRCGCFNNTIEEFEKAVKETHNDNDHYNEYMIAINLAKYRFNK